MATKRGKLTDSHKAFLVQRLACYDSPREAADALSAEYGVQIAAQSAEHYDPTKRAGVGLAKYLTELFERTRADFLANIDTVPEAHRAVRVRQLAHASRAYKATGNYQAMAEMLERIAKEVGNVHTNRREVTGKAGGPMRLEVGEMSDEQLDARLAQLIGLPSLRTEDDTREEERRGSARR